MSEAPKKIKFGVIESFSTAIWREPLTITVSDYPELEGMTEQEMKEYIQNNFWDMKASEENDWGGTLYDELVDGDITKDKIYDEEKEIFFLDVDEDDED
jgi:hypothetical protein